MNKCRTVRTALSPRVLILVALALVVLMPIPAQTQGSQAVELKEPAVVRFFFTDQEHLNAVAGELDVWEVHRDEGYAVAAVSPAQYQWLADLGYRLQVDAEKTALLGVRGPLDPRFYYYDDDYYNSYGRYVVDFLQSVSSTYPNLTLLTDIGDAWQASHGGYHRDMWVLRITNEDAAYGPIASKPAFYLFAQIHAREVATSELAIRYIKYLTEGWNGAGGYNVDPDVTWLVNHNVAYVLVMQNPDGHRVNEQDINNYRRKNMDNDDGCPYSDQWGVDLNRNHSFFWGCCGGSSGNACSETYRGPYRDSEPETAAFQAHFEQVMLDQNGPNGDDQYPPAAPDDATGIFVSLHQYADEILWPYNFNPGGAPNHQQMRTIARKLAYYNGFYPSGFLYTVDGSSDDWVYGKFGIPAYTFEVGPDYGSCGGFFPAYGCIDGIDGMTRNFWAEQRPAFLYMHKIADTPYITSYGPDAQNVAANPSSVPQGVPLELTATIADHRYSGDPLTPIAAAEYFVDAPGADGTGTAMAPSDGSWGGTTEAVKATVDTASLTIGKHYLLVHGKGTNGMWGPFTAVFIEVTSGTGNDMHVGNIVLHHVPGASGRYILVALTNIVDQDNQPVASATVNLEWTLPDGSTQGKQAVTGPAGWAGYFMLWSKQTGIYEACVTNVTKAGYLYDPDQNVETCDTRQVP